MSGVVIGCLIVASLALLWLEHAARRAPTEPAPPRMEVHVCDREGRETSVVTSSMLHDPTLALLVALEVEGAVMLHRERSGRDA